ncbi:MAG: nucleotidyl transferase AbiEii/AbiGii toxin family protein [Bacteroidota bacterium]|nr:nucleotidyl transferase AbiEii/AbiGii toxin family protein [Bacteroidota bacterium]
MISKKCIETEWLNEITKEKKINDKILAEKVIRALFLLEGLAESKLEFIFKGGTALMLLLNSTKRLSIDIDIIITKKIELNEIISKIVLQKHFTKFEIQTRKVRSNIQKAHYKLFYKPTHKTNKPEEYILLDVLFEKSQYQKTITIPVNSSFIKQIDNPLFVKVPDFNNILGEKLTAFAPETTGIPYEKNGKIMAKEIIKQLYDIGTIFNNVDNLSLIKQTFEKFALTELKYRNKGNDINIVLEDIYETSLNISTKGQEGKARFDILQKGLKQLVAFIFSENYHIEKAIIHASKTAYLSKLIQLDCNKIEKFENPLQITDRKIEQPFYTKLNKLKKSNPEAFFYWHKIYELEKGNILTK